MEKYYFNFEILVDEWYFLVVDDLKFVLEGGWCLKCVKLGILLRGEEK